ncbi:MAG TPA: 23S rRNA (guanosine(2251)-2'-O)-methyltransferase RlmB [Nitrospirae bacterium]|nr:23S rRNA (guanosine(2251)-2'-O)-methyltransferase RlmB [Nitrospirota bacterium]
MKFNSSFDRVIYGINPVREALKAKKRFISLYIQKGREKEFEDLLRIANSLSIKTKIIEKTFFDSKFPKGHQGIYAHIIDKKETSFEDVYEDIIKSGEKPFFVILDGIEDPRNLGAIIRTADAVSVHAVIHQKHRSAHLSAVTSKVSAGATEHVRIIETGNIKNVIKKMKLENIKIIGADHEARHTLWEVDLNQPVAVVLGGEDKGIRPTVKSLCDEVLKIPMRGKILSLNVSVAMGIVSFEVLRQRQINLK